MALSDLPFPEINASLNFCAAVLLAIGYALIKSGRRDAHKKVMATALVVSAVFLASYLVSKGVAGRVETKYIGEGAGRWAYYFILITHIPLAASLLYLVPWAVMPAIRGVYEVHKRRARILFPIWMYVSVTGVLVYLFLEYSGSFAAGQSNLPTLR